MSFRRLGSRAANGSIEKVPAACEQARGQRRARWLSPPESVAGIRLFEAAEADFFNAQRRWTDRSRELHGWIYAEPDVGEDIEMRE